ncbi:MAG: GNAT family N-acetyltransferase [Gaiellaceae bacterium]|jgi:predicted N-acetyltransferase YhbS
MKIEQLRSEHAAQVASMCNSEGWDFWSDSAIVKDALLTPGVTTLVATEEGKVIGAAEVISDGAINWVLGALIVSPDRRGQGVGTALIREAFARTGALRLDLLTEDESPSFYRTLPGREMSGFRLYRPQDL